MERLERALELLAERADALPAEAVLDRLDRALAGEGDGVVVRLPGTPAAPPEPSPVRTVRVAVGTAVVVALVVGLGLWVGRALLREDTAATSPTTLTTTPSVTTLLPTATTSTATTSPPVDAVGTARALIPVVEQALNDGDLSLLPLDPGAAVELSGMGLWFADAGAAPPVIAGVDELTAMLEWEHRLGAWFALSQCTDEGAAGTVQISCAVEHGNALTDHTGSTSWGAVSFRVAGGRITAFFDERSTDEFLDVYAAKWVTFVLRDHPDLAASMFTGDGVPVLTEKSALLHVGLVAEWAESWGL